MKRHSVFAIPAVLICLLLAGSNPEGQRRPSLSADLADHPRGPHTHRVIVQAPESGLEPLKRGVLGRLRRALPEAVAVEVDDAQLEALKKNPNFAHLSGDATVRADMAITNKVTGATSVWQGTSGLLGLFGTPGYRRRDCRLGHRDPHRAGHARRGARELRR
jgi:hypothetical protein